MNALKTLGIVVVAVVLGAGVQSLAAPAGTSKSKKEKVRKLVLYPGTPQIGPNTVDVGAPGETQGDMTVLTRPVLRSPSGPVVGRTHVKCVKTDVSTPGTVFLECNGLFRFDRTRDQITFEGGFQFPQETDSRLAITGGTGRYRNARGEFRRVAGGNRPRYELRLIGASAKPPR